ncbi:hypothetical protein DESME_15615 [Desulfitobacterium metallireducens DSM 15288]|uniref:DUF1934 domain-containing protein n=1 Tax=Desulfitobacterium metallireducens DSM 15288 TaxID=871968 RepID=W0EBR3_9FIRM|nr:hypothetical protein DESME_15615 [Desulfitobacterium metallireducens DSM 15288]
MRKSARIQVKGIQVYPDGREDKQDSQVMGSFYKRQGDYYIVYQESEVTGMVGVSTALRVEKNKLTLNRMGAAEQRQIFEKDVLHHSTYVTPFASFYLGALAEEMEISLTELGGHITLKYKLFADDKKISQNTLMILIKEDTPQ